MAQNEIFRLDIIHRRSVVILAVLATLTVMKVASDFFIPIAISMFLVAMAWPIKAWLSQRMPEALSNFGSFLALIMILMVFGTSLYFALLEIIEKLPLYQEKFSQIWLQTKIELASNGVDTREKVKLVEVRELALQALTNFHESVILLVVVLAYVTLALPELTGWKLKLRQCLGKDGSDRLVSTGEKLGKSFQNYFASMLICGAISAVATWIACYILGIDFIVVWSILAFLLSFIPVIGAFLTVIPPTLLAFLQFDGIEMPLTVFATLGIIHMFLGNVIEPKIQGKMLAISPLVVMISLSLWSYLWGIPGALLAAPLTQGIIIACSHYERTQWIACLLSEHRSARPVPQETVEN
jgi:AI-2 transport protein TqsA